MSLCINTTLLPLLTPPLLARQGVEPRSQYCYSMLMQQLSHATRLKLLMPLLYLTLNTVFFFVILKNESIELHHYIGLVVTYGSYILWITARIQLGNAFSIAPKATYLVTSGIYSKLRHPVYYFSTLVVIGINIFVWNIYLLAITLPILILIQIWRIRKEETILMQKFPKEYSIYKQSTWF